MLGKVWLEIGTQWGLLPSRSDRCQQRPYTDDIHNVIRRARDDKHAGCVSLTRLAHRAGLGLVRAVRQDPIGPDEVAGVARRVTLQIILMLGFGLPERSGGCYLGDHLARPQF
jgi:hypothetical protein